MSEYRSNAAKVVSFPSQDDEALGGWPPLDWIDHAEYVSAYVNSGQLGIEALLRVQREGTEMLDLYWQGLPPGKAEKFILALAPKWEELMDLIAEAKEKAKAMLAKRAGNGQ